MSPLAAMCGMGSNVESKEESVIDLEGKGRPWKKDMLSIQADAI